MKDNEEKDDGHDDDENNEIKEDGAQGGIESSRQNRSEEKAARQR